MSETRIAIIKLAEELIRTKGYNGFSYKDISGPLNIKNAAIHYHFPSKEDLGIAVIEKNKKAFDKLISEDLKETSCKDQLQRFIKIYTNSQNANMICFVGALGSSYNGLSEKMQNYLTDVSIEIRSWLKGSFRKRQRAKGILFQ